MSNPHASSISLVIQIYPKSDHISQSLLIQSLYQETLSFYTADHNSPLTDVSCFSSSSLFSTQQSLWPEAPIPSPKSVCSLLFLCPSNQSPWLGHFSPRCYLSSSLQAPRMECVGGAGAVLCSWGCGGPLLWEAVCLELEWRMLWYAEGDTQWGGQEVRLSVSRKWPGALRESILDSLFFVSIFSVSSYSISFVLIALSLLSHGLSLHFWIGPWKGCLTTSLRVLRDSPVKWTPIPDPSLLPTWGSWAGTTRRGTLISSSPAWASKPESFTTLSPIPSTALCTQ